MILRCAQPTQPLKTRTGSRTGESRNAPRARARHLLRIAAANVRAVQDASMFHCLKLLVARILTASIVGASISWLLRDRIPNAGLVFDVGSDCWTNRLKASLLFGPTSQQNSDLFIASCHELNPRSNWV